MCPSTNSIDMPEGYNFVGDFAIDVATEGGVASYQSNGSNKVVGTWRGDDGRGRHGVGLYQPQSGVSGDIVISGRQV